SFVTVNSGNLPPDLLESTLFGHVKGAFTGAVANKRGMFEIANNGTLFLDELGNIPLSTQAKLLRVLQEHEYRPVGDTKTRTTNVRILAATNKDPKAMVAEGTFREDLFYRINVFPIHIPPLRERRDDIPALAFHFLKQFSEELERPVPQFSEGAMSLLMNHDWPGNVRELQNTVHRAVILASDNVIRQAHLANILDTAPRSDLEVPRTSDDLKRVKKIAREKSVEDIEKLFIHETLKRNVWNVTKSAEETGMQRANFQALMKKYNIRVRDTEPPGSGEDS
ncbi:MAG TPA: sigma 54-interacting transcriptional regulator, partial [Ramlibacter sp.]|nr:sigma 54-interacting transcriptional regulator [Ramlibacter sp.]